MTAFALCQGPSCTSDAVQQIGVDGTNLSKVVCENDMHVAWARDELAADQPGAALVRTLLMPYSGEAAR